MLVSHQDCFAYERALGGLGFDQQRILERDLRRVKADLEHEFLGATVECYVIPWREDAEGAAFGRAEGQSSRAHSLAGTLAAPVHGLPPRRGPPCVGFSRVRPRQPSIESLPMYGRSTSGTAMVPSARWWFSMMAMIVRPTAIVVPFRVCTNRGPFSLR